jgi:hypothetical protein
MTSPHPHEENERRGFALYVKWGEAVAREDGVELTDVLEALKHEVNSITPAAETEAVAVVAQVDPSLRDHELMWIPIHDGVAEAPSEAPGPGAGSGSGDRSIEIDLARHRVLIDDREIHFTFREFALLQALVRNEGIVLSRDQLRQATLNIRNLEINTRTIDVHVHRLRAKLGPHGKLISTMHGKGYRYDSKI